MSWSPQLNRLGNELLVVFSILEITNMHLQYFLLSADTFFSLHLIFLPRKMHVIQKNIRADISLVATSSLVHQLNLWNANNLLHKSVASNQLCPMSWVEWLTPKKSVKNLHLEWQWDSIDNGIDKKWRKLSLKLVACLKNSTIIRPPHPWALHLRGFLGTWTLASWRRHLDVGS